MAYCVGIIVQNRCLPLLILNHVMARIPQIQEKRLIPLIVLIPMNPHSHRLRRLSSLKHNLTVSALIIPTRNRCSI
jgi:hypothetical protein